MVSSDVEGFSVKVPSQVPELLFILWIFPQVACNRGEHAGLKLGIFRSPKNLSCHPGGDEESASYRWQIGSKFFSFLNAWFCAHAHDNWSHTVDGRNPSPVEG